MASAPGGKGSARRPSLVSDEQVAMNWDLAFGKKPKKHECKNSCPNCPCKTNRAGEQPDHSEE